jgi:hypothetical protein
MEVDFGWHPMGACVGETSFCRFSGEEDEMSRVCVGKGQRNGLSSREQLFKVRIPQEKADAS